MQVSATYPDQTCIIFTDSIPLFAIFFKLLSPVLPETFQYFGIFGALDFIFMGGIAAVILRKGTMNKVVCIIGSTFFSFSPYIFQRLYNHTALASHWLILAAFALWLYKLYFHTLSRKIMSWGVLLIIASLIHIYFVPMILIFMLFSSIQDLLENNGWEQDLIAGLIIVIADLFLLFTIGAFSSTSAIQGESLGVFSSNLNTLWNPMGKGQILPDLPYNEGQDEGYGYLGMGIWAMLLISISILGIYTIRRFFQYKKDKRNWNRIKAFKDEHAFGICICLTIITSVIIAISPEVVYNQRRLFTIPYPDVIIKLLSIFRATGRFIWCSCYILMFISIFGINKFVKKRKAVILVIAICLMIQVCDLGWFALWRGKYTPENPERYTLTSERWEEIVKGKSHIVYIPLDILEKTKGPDAVYEIANFAIEHDMTVNYFVTARMDDEILEDRMEDMDKELTDGVKDKNNLYILDSEDTGKNYGMNIEIIDDLIVGYY